MLVSTALAIPQIPLSNFSAFELLVAGALLLGIATLLLALSRERRVSVKRSAATDELAVHRERIGKALDALRNQLPHGQPPPPSLTQAVPEPSRLTAKPLDIRYPRSGRCR